MASERERIRAEMQRRAAEAEAARQAKLAAAREAEQARQRQLQAEADAMAALEEQRLADEEAQRRIEEEARLLEQEERQEQAARDAQRTRESDIASNQVSEQIEREADRYIPAIKDRVRQFWVRPPALGRDLLTVVSLRLIPGGDVVPNSVSIVESSGNTAFDQSVIAAVYNASPIPVPSGPPFERFREFNLQFTP
jgi:colicin import membrane protein